MLRKHEFCRLAAQIMPRTISIQIMDEAYDAFCAAAVDALKEGEEVQFNGLVKLSPRVQEECEARNPATNEVVTVPEKVVVKAKVMPTLKRTMAEINVKKFRKAISAKQQVKESKNKATAA